MKEKILYLIIGILIGAIITTGVFLLIDKNKKPTRGQFQTNGQGMNFNPEDMTGATRTVQEDGSVKFEFPDGRVMVRQEAQDGGGPRVTQGNQ